MLGTSSCSTSHREGLGQRSLDFFVKQGHDAIQNVDQIEQNVLALVDDGQAFAGMLFGLPDAGDLEPNTRPQRIAFRRRQARVVPVEQVLRDVLLFAQDRAPGRFGRMPREHGFDAHGGDQFERLRKRHSVAMQARDAIRDAAGLRCARVVEILAAPADSMHFLRRVHRLEPNRKRASKVGGRRGRSAHRPPLQFGGPGGVAFTPLNRRDAVVLDELEEFLAPLVAQHLADQLAQGVHVVPQRRVLDWKLDALAIHSARLSKVHEEIL